MAFLLVVLSFLELVSLDCYIVLCSLMKSCDEFVRKLFQLKFLSIKNRLESFKNSDNSWFESFLKASKSFEKASKLFFKTFDELIDEICY